MFTSRWQEGGAGRKLSFTGFGILCICFFLPQVRACNQQIVPAELAFDEGIASPHVIAMATFLLPFTIAFIAVAIYLLRLICWSAKARRALSMLLRIMVLIVLLIGTAGLTTLLVSEKIQNARYDRPWEAVDTVFACCLAAMLAASILAIVVIVRGRKPVKTPATIGCLGTASTAYFAMFPLMDILNRAPSSDGIYYGIWYSIAASGLIALGGLWEALADRRT